MSKLNQFAAFILTNGRPDNVITYKSLRSHGYTGPIYLICDDEDKTLDQYRKNYGDSVLVFSKEEIASTFDEGDNFRDRRAIIYARNASFGLARSIGIKYFMQLDDDYNTFFYRFNSEYKHGAWKLSPMDGFLSYLIDFFDATPFLSVAMSQGGDHIGGAASGAAEAITTKRKAMNSFLCSTEREFSFFGRVNEDVNTYTTLQRRGGAFLTLMFAQLNQAQTQSSPGGMTEMYLDSGTYIKSFYSVMYGPSCVKVASISDGRENYDKYLRLHHRVKWNACAPKIIRQHHKKVDEPA
jgi:hypothetical protein